mmetsp:Transcript_26357/g.55089  ORF Transcript_26357/g.55089 Transcript_26357/m.55089 type:complete len:85 (+) Transcript_26357:2696-2950(+)
MDSNRHVICSKYDEDVDLVPSSGAMVELKLGTWSTKILFGWGIQLEVWSTFVSFMITQERTHQQRTKVDDWHIRPIEEEESHQK